MRQMGKADVFCQRSWGEWQVPVCQQPDTPVGARTFRPGNTTPLRHPEPPDTRPRPVAHGLGGECACFTSTAMGVMFKDLITDTHAADDPLALKAC
jgi:hypothetical protein